MANSIFITPSSSSGTGTVTTVSVTTANGVSGSVATPTTTPAITLTLGNIVPSGVMVTGNKSAAAWTTGGIALGTVAASFTDTSSSGTVALTAVNALAVPTLLASAATTYTDSATLYIGGAPTASTNVTQTNAWGLYNAANEFISGKLVIGATTGGAISSQNSNDGAYLYKTSTATNFRGLIIGADFTGTSNVTSGVNGLTIAARATTASTGNLTATTNAGGLSGIRIISQHNGTGTVSLATGISTSIGNITGGSASGVVTDSANFQAEFFANGAAQAWGTWSSYWARGGAFSGGSLTTRYGLRIDDLIAGTTRYGIYQSGTSDNNVLAGKLRVGAASDPTNALDVTGVINATTGFQVNGAATSGNVLKGDGTNFISSTPVAAGLLKVVGSTFEKPETGTDANVLTYTTNASTDEFLTVNVAVDISALTGTSVAATVTWKDSNNATATSTVTLTGVTDGTISIPINAFKNTNVVVSTVFIGASTAYNISAVITRLL